MKPEIETKKKAAPQEERYETLVRILGQDISGNKSIYAGLTYIKGISWSISNAVCLKLGIDRHIRVSELNKEQIATIEKAVSKIDVPDYMKNRRYDPETGESKHLLANDLDIAKEFDIKRLKKMKSYRGLRHAFGLPVRGQRTRSHFKRKKGIKAGIKKNDKKA
ncbi:MAG TPA: 30S ribosomal protein S13 [Candidatus Nanoarchaeia archaeon]|nr:30S ribosomal protein S13 [Candidatus Nanoarchaeia archaeon]